MATVTVHTGMTNIYWANLFQVGDLDTANIITENSSNFTYRVDVGGTQFDVTLSSSGNFTYGTIAGYSGTELSATGGTVTSISVTNHDTLQSALSIDSISFSFEQAFWFLFNYDDGRRSHGATDHGIDFLFSGNDTFTVDPGISTDDHFVNIAVGDNAGNDKVTGNDQNNYFDTDRGNDKYFGLGGNYDTLSYMDSFWRQGAFIGINLDAIKISPTKGSATDPWGGTDTFSGIENFEGSIFKDVIKGANQTTYWEWFSGFQGNDTIDGRGGFNLLNYENEANFPGGLHGISANLSILDANGFAHVADAYGTVDKVKHIQGIKGTMFDDTLIGDAHDNVFMGMAGQDFFDGKAGIDRLDFSSNDYSGGIDAVSVDLNQATEILDDGFGKSENANNFENIVGTNFGDTLKGNGLNNELIGGDGNDDLTGRGGADTFGFVAPPNGTTNHDIIQDFSGGGGEGDKIALLNNGDAFDLDSPGGGTLLASEFLSGAGANAATNNSEHIIYNETNGDLYYDHDGLGGDAPELIANLNGAPALATTDFIIWT